MKSWEHFLKHFRSEDILESKKSKLDPVGKEDEDIDNDGDSDESDSYLRRRREVRGKIIADKLNKTSKSKKNEDKEESGEKEMKESSLLEREMTSAEKKKETKLKKKYDPSSMKEKMVQQYGPEKGKRVYFATIRKQAMESVEDSFDSAKKKDLTEAKKDSKKIRDEGEAFLNSLLGKDDSPSPAPKKPKKPKPEASSETSTQSSAPKPPKAPRTRRPKKATETPSAETQEPKADQKSASREKVSKERSATEKAARAQAAARIRAARIARETEREKRQEREQARKERMALEKERLEQRKKEQESRTSERERKAKESEQRRSESEKRREQRRAESEQRRSEAEKRREESRKARESGSEKRYQERKAESERRYQERKAESERRYKERKAESEKRRSESEKRRQELLSKRAAEREKLAKEREGQETQQRREKRAGEIKRAFARNYETTSDRDTEGQATGKAIRNVGRVAYAVGKTAQIGAKALIDKKKRDKEKKEQEQSQQSQQTTQKNEQFSNWREEFIFEIDDPATQLKSDKKMIDVSKKKNKIEINPQMTENCGCEDKEKETEVKDTRGLSTRVNLIKNKLRSMGIKNPVVMVADDDVKEDWQKVNRQDNTDGLSQKAVDAYRRENPGSKLQTAVTEKNPSGKRAERRKAFCRRMSGMKNKLTSAKTARDPDSRINKALRRWNCN